MPRPLTGCVVWAPHADGRTGHWKARITLPDGRRPWVHFETPDGYRFIDPSPAGKARAQEAALGKTELFHDPSVVQVEPEVPGETVAQYAERWLASRDGKIASNYDTGRMLQKYVLPEIGHLAMVKVTPRDLEAIVEKLDRLADDDVISARYAINIWAGPSKLFDDAAHSKQKDLRCLEINPAEHVRGPDTGERKMLQFLYPSEFVSFWECDVVPVAFKREVAFAIYLCLRDGEQRALKWSDVDLEHGIVRIARKFDRRSWAEKDGTKAGAGRIIPIPDALMSLVRHMAEQAEANGEEYVFGDPAESLYGTKSEVLRNWLTKAGVTRPELHVTTKVSRQLRWHDLRATGGTWYAVEGRSATEIRDILGHTQTSMTDRYMRAAGMLRGLRFGRPFPELHGGKVSGKVLVLSKSPTSLDSVKDTRPNKSVDNDVSSLNPQSASDGSSPAASSKDSKRRHEDDSLDVSTAPSAESSALARALEAATAAGQWQVVASIAQALTALQSRAS